MQAGRLLGGYYYRSPRKGKGRGGGTAASRMDAQLAAITAAGGTGPIAGTTIGKAGEETAKAFAQSPGKVSGRTALGLRDAAVGAPGAIAKVVADTAAGTASGDPLKGVKGVGKRPITTRCGGMAL